MKGGSPAVGSGAMPRKHLNEEKLVTFADPDGGDVVGDAGVGGEHHHAQHGEGGPGQGHQQRHEPHLRHRQITTDR